MELYDSFASARSLGTPDFSQEIMAHLTSCTGPPYRCVTPKLIKRNWPLRLLNGYKNPPKTYSFCDQVRSLHQTFLSQHKKEGGHKGGMNTAKPHRNTQKHGTEQRKKTANRIEITRKFPNTANHLVL